ncbi:MAG: cyanoexosortase B [Oscillatoria sp. SIO1A7]|nr:cyanoexosortase B [Oscillatoria sp. SIO1A7]
MQIQHKINFVEQYLGWIIIAVLAAVYAPLMLHWYHGWMYKSISLEHEYFSHGLIGLPFAAWISWQQRKRWQRLTDTAHPLGAALLLLAGFFYLTGVPDFVNLSLPIVLAGICLWLKGFPGLKLQKFPLLLVVLATPNQLPYLISPYTLPLQSFIAGTAGLILLQFGIDVTVENIYLYVGETVVEVAPHCSGLKMLLTSLYVALMLLYWSGKFSRGKSILFLVSTVVVSVTGNIIRNTILTFFHGTGRDELFEWMHAGWGGDVYSACLLGSLVLLLPIIEKGYSYFKREVIDNY